MTTTDQHVKDLADALTATAADAKSWPMGLYFTPPGSRFGDTGRAVENEVFAEAFGDTSDELAEAYGPYDDASGFLVVIDHQQHRPVGVIRVILPSPAGLRDLDALAEPPWEADHHERNALLPTPYDLSTMLDVASVAVVKSHRGTAGSPASASFAACRSVLRISALAGVPSWCAVLDTPALTLLNHVFGPGFGRWPGVADGPFLGSECSTPVHADVTRWWATMADDRPATWAAVQAADPSGGAVRPLDESAAVDCIREWYAKLPTEALR